MTGRWVTDFVTKQVGDKKVAEGRIAVQKTKDTADFFDVKCWEKTAEIASQYCKKGGFAIIASGRLSQETWEKDGEKRSKVVIVVDRLDLPPLPPKEESEGKSSAASKTVTNKTSAKQEEEEEPLF